MAKTKTRKGKPSRGKRNNELAPATIWVKRIKKRRKKRGRIEAKPYSVREGECQGKLFEKTSGGNVKNHQSNAG